jgi:hypothetical protein
MRWLLAQRDADIQQAEFLPALLTVQRAELFELISAHETTLILERLGFVRGSVVFRRRERAIKRR